MMSLKIMQLNMKDIRTRANEHMNLKGAARPAHPNNRMHRKNKKRKLKIFRQKLVDLEGFRPNGYHS